MALIDLTKNRLQSERNKLEKAFKTRDWDAVRKTDKALERALELAVDSDSYDKRELLSELAKIVDCYKEGIEQGALKLSEQAEKHT